MKKNHRRYTHYSQCSSLSIESTMVDTSLCINLNIKPSDNTQEDSKTEFQGAHASESKPTVKEEPDVLMKERDRMIKENKKLTQMLIFVCENYKALQSQLMDLIQKNSRDELQRMKNKRKADGEICGIDGINAEGSCSDEVLFKRPKETMTNTSVAYVRTSPSDMSLVVKDGYQWRKYGQKVTRDNASPRAYYKCSFAPSCPVKKKVQKSVGDPSVLVAIYEGKHNHSFSAPVELPPLLLNQRSSPSSIPDLSSTSSGPVTALDLNKVETEFFGINANKPTTEIDELQQFLVENMTSSLMRNSSFTSALATAISRRILDHDHEEGF